MQMDEVVAAVCDKHTLPKKPKKPRETKDAVENAKRKAEYDAQLLRFEEEDAEHQRLMKERKVLQRKAARHQQAVDTRARRDAEWEAGAEERRRANHVWLEQRQQARLAEQAQLAAEAAAAKAAAAEARAERERREAQARRESDERQARRAEAAAKEREIWDARKAASDKRRCPMCVKQCFDNAEGHVCFMCGQTVSCCSCPPPPENPLHAAWRANKAAFTMKMADDSHRLLPLLHTMWEQALFGSDDDGVRIADDFYVDAAWRHTLWRSTGECTPFGDWFPCDIEYGDWHNTVRRLVHRTTREVVYCREGA